MDLYRLYDEGGRLLYVGISYSAIARQAGHRNDKGWWCEVARMTVQKLGDISRVEAERIESEAIVAEKPRHNKSHNGDRGSALPVARPRVEGDFELRGLAHLPEWHDAIAALDRVARRLDRAAREGRDGVPSRFDFLSAVASAAKVLPYGDMCDGCGEIRYPVALRTEARNWARCGYWCPACRTEWTSGWTTDLVALAL